MTFAAIADAETIARRLARKACQVYMVLEKLVCLHDPSVSDELVAHPSGHVWEALDDFTTDALLSSGAGPLHLLQAMLTLEGGPKHAAYSKNGKQSLRVEDGRRKQEVIHDLVDAHALAHQKAEKGDELYGYSSKACKNEEMCS